jgi:MFS family permease
MVFAYVVEAVCVVVLAGFTLSGSREVWPVFAAMALFGAGRAFWMPSAQAMVVNLVPAEVFPSAVGLNSTLFQSAVIAGPAVGGVLYALGESLLEVDGALVVYAVALALLVLVIWLIAGVRPVRAPPSQRPVTTREFFEGLRFVFGRRPVLGAISLDLFAVLFGGATALLPVFAADILHVGPVGLGTLRTAPGVGAALTAALLATRPIERHAGRWMFSGVALFATATMVFGLSTSFVVSLLALFLLGIGDMVSVFVRHLLVQLETPDAIRGRVSAVSAMFIGASNELGEFESGVTAKWFGTVPAVIIGGLACAGVVLVYLRLFPELRRLDRFPQPQL